MCMMLADVGGLGLLMVVCYMRDDVCLMLARDEQLID